jgi:hypothetical protein
VRSAVAAGQTAAGRLELFGAIDGTAKRVGARRVETAKRRMGWERRQPMRAAAPARVHASLAATGLRRAAPPRRRLKTLSGPTPYEPAGKA